MSKRLKDYKEGSTVAIGGQDWVVLEHNDDGGTFCLRKDSLKKAMPFDTGEDNNWAASSLRAYLNGEYADELMEQIPEAKAVRATMQDLTAEDGTKYYGACADMVTLLTCGQYRRYRERFPASEKSWWLLTADSKQNSCVRYVAADGSLKSCRTRAGFYGVRPACTFRSSIAVTVDASREMARFIAQSQTACPFWGSLKNCDTVFGQEACEECIQKNAHLLNA